MLQTFHFLRPEWLFVIPVIAIALLFFVQRAKNDSGWEKVCDPELLHYQLTQQNDNTRSSRLLHWIIPLVLFICVVALAGPSWEKKEQPIFQQGNALIIILDLSLSMNAKDIKPSRLERAKLKITDILKQKKEGQTALIAFAGDAHVVSPLTIDHKTIMSLLPALDSTIMPVSGSHIIDALQNAKQLLQNSGFAQGDILLMTDGIDKTEQSHLKKSVKTLRNQGYRFSVIGIGSQAGSPIPVPDQGGFVKDASGQVILSKLTAGPLIQLTQLGGGSYHPLSLNDSDFKALLDRRLLNNNSVTKQDNQLEQWVDAGAYVTLILIPVALLAFRKGLMSIAIVMVFLPPFLTEPVYANDNSKPTKEKWNDLWLTPDQQGQKAFNSQDFQNAADKFNHPQWQASSYYRAGDYEKALRQYEQAEDATSLYNKGNSLANLQKFQEAITAYDNALKINPDLKDAASNRDYLTELLKQQSQQQSSQNSQQQKENSDSQEQSQQNDSDSDSENSSQDDDSTSSESEQESTNQEKSDSNKEGSGHNQKDSEQKEAEQQESNEQTAQENTQPKEPVDPESYQQPSDKKNPDGENAQQSQKEHEQGQAEETSDQVEAETQPDDVLSQLSQEEQQSLKQWLQRIPDNPGELLRIKFRNNSLLKQRQKQASEQYEGNPW